MGEVPSGGGRLTDPLPGAETLLSDLPGNSGRLGRGFSFSFSFRLTIFAFNFAFTLVFIGFTSTGFVLGFVVVTSISRRRGCEGSLLSIQKRFRRGRKPPGGELPLNSPAKELQMDGGSPELEWDGLSVSLRQVWRFRLRFGFCRRHFDFASW